jgi:hypothetical protein
MQQENEMDPHPHKPTVPAGTWGLENRELNLTNRQETQQKRQAPNDEKTYNRIKTDSSHTVEGQKEKGKRSIWSETTHFHSKLLTFYWTSSPSRLRISQRCCVTSAPKAKGPVITPQSWGPPAKQLRRPRVHLLKHKQAPQSSPNPGPRNLLSSQLSIT